MPSSCESLRALAIAIAVLGGWPSATADEAPARSPCDPICLWERLERVRPDSVEILGVARAGEALRVDVRYIACVDDSDDLATFARRIEAAGLGRARPANPPPAECGPTPKLTRRALLVHPL